MLLVSVFSLNCEHTREWCGQHYTWSRFLLELKNPQGTHFNSTAKRLCISISERWISNWLTASKLLSSSFKVSTIMMSSPSGFLKKSVWRLESAGLRTSFHMRTQGSRITRKDLQILTFTEKLTLIMLKIYTYITFIALLIFVLFLA